MNKDSIQDIQHKYIHYNTQYTKMISGRESILRGVMHYKKISHDLYINTTLFSGVTEIEKGLVVEKQKEIQKKIILLQELLYRLREEREFYQYGIAKFLERNIDKTISVFGLISHATLWIEANKGGLLIHKKHLQTCHEMTLIYHKNTLGNTLHSQPKQEKIIHRYLLSLYTKRTVEIPGVLTKRLKKEGLLENNNKIKSSVPVEKKLSPEECVSIVLLCVDTMLRITKEKKKIVLFLEKKSLLTENKQIKKIIKKLHIEIIYEKKDILHDCFCVHVGTSGWRISKNIFYAPATGLEISLLALCEIIDHELGTHAATNLADTALLNRKSHGYSKMEEGMAVFNQRMVSCVSVGDLKRTPTYHHIACYFAETMSFDELRAILYDFFLLLGNTKRLATKNAHLTSLRAKRYVLFSKSGSNSHLLAYTDGYLYFLDMFAKSQQIDDNSFRLLWKWMHLGKFSSKDLHDIKPFLRLIKSDIKDITKPIYFGRCIYHYVYLSKPLDEIIEKDARYNRTGKLDDFEKTCLQILCDTIPKIISLELPQ